MAKHDSARSQNQINNQGTTAQDSQNALMNQLQGQNQGFTNNYNVGTGLNLGDYNLGQNNYNNLYNQLASGNAGVGIGAPGTGGQQQGNMPQIQGATSDPDQIGQWLQAQAGQPGSDPILQTPDGIKYYTNQIINSGGLNPQNTSYWQNKSTLSQYGGAVGAGGGGTGSGSGALGSSQAGFQNFADTGGFSPQDIQDMRARSQSAMRSTYQNAQDNLDRNRSLQQFSPNYAAATAKLTRDLGYGLSDAATNSNAAIAQMIQSGKLAGNQGLMGVGGINQQGQIANQNAMLGALQGSSSLYGATPGLASTFGNQMLNSSGQLVSGNQNQTQLGSDIMNAQNYKGANVKGDTSQAISNVGSVIKPAAQIGAAIMTGGASLAVPGGGLYGPGSIGGGGGY